MGYMKGQSIYKEGYLMSDVAILGLGILFGQLTYLAYGWWATR